MDRQKSSNRRTFLKATGAMATAGGLGLAGCLGGNDDGTDDGNNDDAGGDDGSGSSDDSGGDESTPVESRGDAAVREEYGLPELDYELEDTLNVFQWTDYWPEGTVEIFEKAYDVEVKVANYASNEEMFNKLKAGGSGQFDVTFPSDYMLNIMVEQDVLQPLDLDKIPHWDNLEPKWVDEAPYDPGSDRYSAPYQWGTTGVGWNKNMEPDLDPSSWEVIFDEQYAGQITMLNDMRETIGAALKYLGYSLNSTDEAKIDEAKELLIDQKDLLLTYESTVNDENLINEQASPAHMWSGDAFAAYWELWTEEDGSPIGYQVPDEGGVVWIDTAAITKEAKSPNAAHAFINFVENAKVHAEISNYVYYGSPNKAAKEFIYEDALNNEAIYPPEDAMAKLEFIENLGQATTMWNDAWTEIQNA